uniref:Alpha-mannosidase n=1 Tax=Panagrellus redivivus TaxID=6233 RepID=A0A7E4VA72_PANRE
MAYHSFDTTYMKTAGWNGRLCQSTDLRPSTMRLLTAFVAVSTVIGLSLAASQCAWDQCPAFKTDGTLNLHLLAHSHDDVGWLKTADDYFTGYNANQVNHGVQYIYDSVLNALKRNKNRKFSVAEIGFFTRWLEDRPQQDVDDIKALINNGQLEIIGGGWVQPDEAASHYIELIDMYTLGLRKIQQWFGTDCTSVRSGWQIDPFGHSREHANLLYQMGHESVYFAREHHKEHDWRKANKKLEFNWYTSDENPTRKVLGGAFYAHYNQPGGMCWDARCNDDPVIVDPELENYNVDAVVDHLNSYLNNRLPTIPHNNVLFMMGDDFHYQNAEQNMRNLDNLITAVRNKTNYNIFYSTPACYTKALKESGHVFSNKTYDFFPYASGSTNYWSGYFSSKPAHKGLVRTASNVLNSIRQSNVFAKLSNITEWTSGEETLERAVGLSLHHDGITGTSKDHVTRDYVKRLLEGWDSITSVVQNAYQAISQRVKSNTQTFPTQVICKSLNETACQFVKDNSGGYTITLSNAHSRTVKQLVRIPAYNTQVKVTDASGNDVNGVSVVKTFKNDNQIKDALAADNEAKFVAEIPAHGFATYFVTVGSKAVPSAPVLIEKQWKPAPREAAAARASLTNGLITVNFDGNNLVQSVTDDSTKKTYPLKQSFLYYRGHARNGQNSGAYVFRPEESTANEINKAPSLTTVGTEARQTFSDWVTQTVRLIPGKKYVEFEWTVGPLPDHADGDTKYGTELITRYEVSGIDTKATSYTDANGRQLIKRVRNFNPDFEYENNEPVAGNYVPVTSTVVLKDSSTAAAILVDRAVAGGQIQDNSFELLIHRRDYYDDGYGVGEALNEPGQDGRGLIVRGRHRVFFSDPSSIAQLYREGTYELINDPVITFGPKASASDYSSKYATKYTGLAKDVPANLRILTLKQLDTKTVLFRIEHIYAKDEDSNLSKPVTIDISTLFADLKVTAAQETLLGSNQEVQGSTSTTVTLNPQDIKTFKLTVA